VAGDRERGQQELVAGVEHGRGHAAQGEDEGLDQHQPGQAHGQLAGRGVEAGGEHAGDEGGREQLPEQHEQGEDGQQRREDQVGQPPLGGRAARARGADQHGDHGAREGAAGDQAVEEIGEAEGCVVGAGLRAGAELGVEEHLANRAQRGREEERGHEQEGGLVDAELAREQPPAHAQAGHARREDPGGGAAAEGLEGLEDLAGQGEAHPGRLGQRGEAAEPDRGRRVVRPPARSRRLRRHRRPGALGAQSRAARRGSGSYRCPVYAAPAAPDQPATSPAPGRPAGCPSSRRRGPGGQHPSWQEPGGEATASIDDRATPVRSLASRKTGKASVSRTRAPSARPCRSAALPSHSSELPSATARHRAFASALQGAMTDALGPRGAGVFGAGVIDEAWLGKPHGHLFVIGPKTPRVARVNRAAAQALAEMLFVSNPRDAALLAQDGVRELLAAALDRGVASHLASAPTDSGAARYAPAAVRPTPAV
jgi:hypothetical protein